MTDYLEYLPYAAEAVDLASEIVRNTPPGLVTSKGDRDMASEVDYAVERDLRQFFLERTPHVAFLGEENGLTNEHGHLTWALDPLDGTVNFLHRHPLCAVSLALVADTTPVLGVVTLPFLGSRYVAVRDHFVTANGHAVAAGAADLLRNSVIAIGDYAIGPNSQDKNRFRFELTRLLAARVQRVRMHGSAAIDLAWLAEGRIDGVVIAANHPWDTAAGVVIAQEAGCVVLDIDGSAHDTTSQMTIATNPRLAKDLLALVQEAHLLSGSP